MEMQTPARKRLTPHSVAAPPGIACPCSAEQRNAAQAERGPAQGKRQRHDASAVGLEVLASGYRPTLADVQSLLLRVFTTEYGQNPRWVNVAGMSRIRSATVVLVPCLDLQTLSEHRAHAPLLWRLACGAGSVASRSAGDIEGFPAEPPVPLVGDRLLRLLLSAKNRPSVTSGKAKAQPKAAQAEVQLPIREYLASTADRIRSGYPMPGTGLGPGWVTTKRTSGAGGNDAGNTADREGDPDRSRLVALDCEMVMTASGPALARVSAVDAEGRQLLDMFVRPTEEVTDHLTAFSGITAEHLQDVSAALPDAQARLLELVSEDTVLVGHSLENDLQALRLVHERVVDTVLLYPHSLGWPNRLGLKQLVTQHLRRPLDRSGGHDSLADARAALDLALVKFEKGPSFGVRPLELISLGRLLQTGRSQLSLFDSDKESGGRGVDDWHLEACAVHRAADDDAVAALAAAVACPACEASVPREVRLVVLRGFESWCRGRAAEDATTQRSPAACLTSLERCLALLAETLGASDVLLVLNGCGNLHGLSSPGRGAASARRSFTETFAALAVGRSEEQREIVVYDDL